MPRYRPRGVSVFNGIGNIVGALSPLVMGALIAQTGAFDAGASWFWRALRPSARSP